MDNNYFMVYPVYIDSSKTKAAGRKYSKTASVLNPKLPEIKAVLDKLKLEYKYDANKRHPRDQLVYGRFSIKKEGDKEDTIKTIVSTILEERNKKIESNKSKVPNLLNLVPRKRKGKNKK